ncbi:D-alanyl-D-alanine carboxypeptidase [Roseiarcus fermentans]|uniref:D-alanyl-D-alanine carboxypeptidase n=1 Tax=Roseiarcus fermentans TaxID=1473586 RepID=A0A366FRU2_9HYPH|nr:D-alanyl-D-alanine carboxypeptidase family protein [Roseiarcus fermentans]RBP16455.1 D-alanyl-D-alanine carboxypeptidase [Roseiarcus fermentans]
MPFGVSSVVARLAAVALAVTATAASASDAPYLVADIDSGQVLIQNNATAEWYPASTTKLMTVYVALDAVRAGRLTMETPLVVSARAASQQPSKMGFRPGTEVTLDNALKMLMVKSPNDIAVTVAEGVSGSVEAFAGEMNAAAERLGLHESHFVNPNGLHNANHMSSARDMALIARALLKEFPQEAGLFSIGALQLDQQIIRNHNGLLGRYPGVDGMKTGFTCPAGFNIVATANHSGRHLVAVVFGAPSARLRNQETADLFDRGFAMWGGGSGSLDSLPSSGGSAPSRSANVCLHRSAAAVVAEEEDGGGEQAGIRSVGRGGGATVVVAAAGAPTHTELTDERPQFDPVPIFVGPVAGWTGPVLGPRKVAAVAALPADAKAYAGDKPGAVEQALAPDGPDAPQALAGAVRTPAPEGTRHHPKSKRVAAVGDAGPSEKPKAGAGPAEVKRAAAKPGKAAEAKAQPVKPPPRPSDDQ